jgi:hypothetical protein
VQSPSATASVRGTVFEFDAINLKVYEGTVVLKGGDDMGIPVPVGATSHVDPYGKVFDPIESRRQALSPPAPVGTGKPSSSGSPQPAIGTINVTIREGK